MKAIDYPQLSERYELDIREKISEEKIFIEMKPVQGNHQKVIEYVRSFLIKMQYQGFRIKEINRVYCRVDASYFTTIGEVEELQTFLGLGMKAEVFLYIDFNQKRNKGNVSVSMAIEYEKKLYESEVIARRINQLIEKRSDYLILHRMFKDEKYYKRAKKIMKLLKKLETNIKFNDWER